MLRRPRSKHEAGLLELASRLLPAGVRSPASSPDYAMVIGEARGSRIRDLSGNEYIDYLLGSGPMLLGHAHPAVTAAVAACLERGSSYLMVNEPAIRLAERIGEIVPGAEMVSFHNSGSEATFFAMRLARAHRGRDKILKFEGGYHGMSDYALMSNQWTSAPAPYPRATANSAGIPASVAGEVLIAPFNDIATTAEIIERNREDLAGVIVEPMQRTIPPRPGFLQGLREVTRRADVPLIFDEVVTGFRLALGGAQEYYGVTADLCATGKSISGGFPLGVVCGSAEIMSRAALSTAAEPALLTGTYSGNPVSCSAALACIEELAKPGCYQRLFERGRTLMNALQSLLDDAGVKAQVSGEPPAFQPWFSVDEMVDFRSMATADAKLGSRFTELLIDRGVVKAHEKFFVSTAHSDEDLKLTIDAFAAAAERLAS